MSAVDFRFCPSCAVCGFIHHDRELAEETGLAVRVDRVIGAYASVYEIGRQTVDVGFACTVVGGTFALSEEKSDARWVATDDLPPMAFPAQREALGTVVDTTPPMEGQ